VATGGDWLPGLVVRDPMSRWQFADATDEMARASGVLAHRDALRSTDARLGLTVPPSLETGYESARTASDLAALDADIQAWTTAAERIDEARSELAGPRDTLTTLGLSSSSATPEAVLADATQAYDAGDRASATRRAAEAVSILRGAAAIGRAHVLEGTVAAVVGLGALFALVTLLWRRGRSRRRSRLATEGSSGAAPGAPYATLAATSAPLEAARPGPETDQGAGRD